MHAVPSLNTAQVPDPVPADLFVLDVREDVEWHHGHVEGSLHVPLHDLPGRLDELPRDRQVLVVCRVGGRSAQATAWLQHQGVDALNLDGGLLEWHAAGRSLVSDAGDHPVVV